MSDYVISCCSTADLTKEHFEKRNISYICFHYELNGKEYADDLGQSMPFDQFYKAMQDGASTKTSQVNADEFEEYFEGFLKEGKDVLHVCLSSGISGVINSANVAKADLEEKYPGRKILVVDSLGASSGYGLFMDKLADLRDEGRLDYSGKCYISQSACIEDAREVARLVEERFPKLNGKVEINNIGTTIGSHTGPGTVALFFWGNKRTA